MAKDRKDDTPAEDAKETEVKMERDGKTVMVDPDAVEDYKERGWKLVKEEKDNPFKKKDKDEDSDDDDEDDSDDDDDDKEDMKEDVSAVSLAMAHKPEQFAEVIRQGLFDRVKDAIDTRRADVAASYFSTETE